MRRTSSLAVLGACLALLGAVGVATLGAIAAGAWQPMGERPVATPRVEPSGQPGQPGQPPGGVAYETFLGHVTEGRVIDVYHEQESDLLHVSLESDGYQVAVPPGADVFGDIAAAAAAGGVQRPPYTPSGGGRIEDRSYAAFLDEVGTGRVLDVLHTGSRLEVTTADGSYGVDLDDPLADVLGDVEAAAEAAGVRPPSYTKLPG